VNKLVSAANGIDYAYRDTGTGAGGLPLVLLQHFRGNLDNWDPALIDALASTRRVIAFDNTGVGGSTGATPDTVEQMARDAIAFLAAMDLGQVDLLGFSIGSFVAQEMTLIRPALVRRLILASSAPQGAAGMHGWAPEVIGAVGKPETRPEDLPSGVLRPVLVKPEGRPGSTWAHLRPDPGPGQANNLGHPRGAVRRGLRLGNPGSLPVAAAERHRPAGIRGERR
jgi:pimeloyl-ACP methyl ester carboxylesterase